MSDIVKLDLKAVVELGEYFVERLGALEKQYRSGHPNSTEALAEFNREWPRLQRTFQVLAPRIHDDAQIANICRNLPLACTSLFLVRFAPPQRVEWLTVAVEATKQLRAWHKGPSLEFELLLCGELGSALLDSGRFQEAEPIYRTAVAVAQSLGDKESEAKWLGNLAIVLAETHQFQRALQLSKQSLELAHATGFKRLYGDQLRLAGTICVDLGEYATALEYLFRALEVHMEGRHPLEVGTDLGEIGIAYKAQGDRVSAKQFLIKALEASKSLGHEQSERVWRAHLRQL